MSRGELAKRTSPEDASSILASLSAKGTDIYRKSNAGSTHNRGKILWFSWRNIHHPWSGGEERFHHRVCTCLAEYGYDVTVVSCKTSEKQANQLRTRYRTLEIGTHDSYPILAFLYALWRGRQYNIVVEDTSKIPLYLLVPRKLVVVHHLSRLIFFEELGPIKAIIAYLLETLMPKLYPRLFRRSHFISVSQNTKQELVKMGIPPGKIARVHVGVDEEPERSSYLEKTPYPSFCFVGRLMKYKRPDHALRAFSRILATFPDARMTFVGDGEMNDSLKELAGQLRVEDHVEFLGRIPDNIKFNVFAKSWINLVTSEKEGWGSVVIEAACASTPTIAYNNSALGESIIDGETGILVQNGNLDSLAKASLNLLEDEERRAQMSTKAFKHSLRFDWSKTAAQFETVFSDSGIEFNSQHIELAKTSTFPRIYD